jgi:hypothetical protein
MGENPHVPEFLHVNLVVLYLLPALGMSYVHAEFQGLSIYLSVSGTMSHDRLFGVFRLNHHGQG